MDQQNTESPTATAAPKVGDVVTVLAIVRSDHDGAMSLQIVGENANIEKLTFTGPTAVVPSSMVAPWRNPMPHFD